MKLIVSAITILLSSLHVQAISEREFIVQLKDTHPFFEQQALNSEIKRVEKRLTSANEDWIIAIDSNYKNEDASDISSSTYNKLNITSVDISAKRKIANSGSNVILKHTWTEKDKAGTDAVSNKFSLDYVYPLLRNKDGVNDRLDRDIAQIAIEKNKLERLEKEENFILKKLKRFIDLAYYQEQQLINQRRLALAEQELNLVKKKYAASVVDKVDVLLQEDAYQRAQQQSLKAQQDLILLRHEIAITLALDFNQVINQM